MAQASEFSDGSNMTWGDLAVGALLEWFADKVWPNMGVADQRRYQYKLTRFAVKFRRMPDYPELVSWLQTLPRARGEGTISRGTMFGYYERYRYLYKCAVLGYPPARDLALLPYDSFRPKEWKV